MIDRLTCCEHIFNQSFSVRTDVALAAVSFICLRPPSKLLSFYPCRSTNMTRDVFKSCSAQTYTSLSLSEGWLLNWPFHFSYLPLVERNILIYQEGRGLQIQVLWVWNLAIRIHAYVILFQLNMVFVRNLIRNISIFFSFSAIAGVVDVDYIWRQIKGDRNGENGASLCLLLPESYVDVLCICFKLRVHEQINDALYVDSTI